MVRPMLRVLPPDQAAAVCACHDCTLSGQAPNITVQLCEAHEAQFRP